MTSYHHIQRDMIFTELPSEFKNTFCVGQIKRVNMDILVEKKT